MIFRDDDISVSTDVAVLKPVHNILKEGNVMHTVAVIAKDLDQNVHLIEYLKKENFDVQLHCWEHINLDENKHRLADDIAKSWAMFERCGFDKPTTLYPPWNISSNAVEAIAGDFGLTVSRKKCSLSYYVKNNGVVDTNVINFHYWDKECDDLAEAIRIYNLLR